MTWLVQANLVNDPLSDPGLLIDFRFGRRALLFDLGDVTSLSPRQLLRVSHAFVSHAHRDHFAGLDRLMRVCLHGAMPLHLMGPAGFADRVEHKLPSQRTSSRLRYYCAVLDHGTPCLAFAFEEKLRVNVWSEGLGLLRLGVGPWLNEAKRAVRGVSYRLAVLKQHVLRTGRGQKIAYVVDAEYHERNVDKIISLARGADRLFIEAAFLDADAGICRTETASYGTSGR
jgi:ribonuclease Z